MTHNPNRIEESTNHKFSGHQIDRKRPLSFKLNGVEIHGFVGDTILSAVLASGLNSIGDHHGDPLALSGCLSLAVRPTGARNANLPALPIERTPALDKQSFETIGARTNVGMSLLSRLFGRGRTQSLRVELDTKTPIPQQFDDAALDTLDDVDVAIIGGGIAGLAAAKKATELGQKIVMFEQRSYLGGDAEFFGNVAGEPKPDIILEELTAAVSNHALANIYLSTEVQSISDHTITAHQVHIVDGELTSRLIRVNAKNIVLATGCSDDLPVFQGNRLPGICGLSQAFHMASAYGVWPNLGNCVVAASDNLGYRLSFLAHDAGIPIVKYLDSRISPQSRFAAFSKARGIRSESGVKIAYALGNAKQSNLTLGVELAWDSGSASKSAELHADSLITSGGWQPRLELWQKSGCEVAIDASGAIVAGAGPQHIKLVGSCAGFANNAAVLESGIRAVQRNFARPPIEDSYIDPVFETPQGTLPVSQLRDHLDRPPAYFSQGWSLLSNSKPVKPGFFQSAVTPFSSAVRNSIERAMSLSDIRSIVATKFISPTIVDAIIQERCITPIQIKKPANQLSEIPEHEHDRSAVPAYLEGRFGPKARVWKISGIDSRTCATGDLLFANSDSINPKEALGVVISGGPDGYAYVASSVTAPQLVARGISGNGNVVLAADK